MEGSWQGIARARLLGAALGQEGFPLRQLLLLWGHPVWGLPSLPSDSPVSWGTVWAVGRSQQRCFTHRPRRAASPRRARSRGLPGMGNTGWSVAAMPAGIPARSIVSCARRALGTTALGGSTLEAGLSLQPWGVADAVGMRWHLGARLVPIHGRRQAGPGLAGSRPHLTVPAQGHCGERGEG